MKMVKSQLRYRCLCEGEMKTRKECGGRHQYAHSPLPPSLTPFQLPEFSRSCGLIFCAITRPATSSSRILYSQFYLKHCYVSDSNVALGKELLKFSFE